MLEKVIALLIQEKNKPVPDYSTLSENLLKEYESDALSLYTIGQVFEDMNFPDNATDFHLASIKVSKQTGQVSTAPNDRLELIMTNYLREILTIGQREDFSISMQDPQPYKYISLKNYNDKGNHKRIVAIGHQLQKIGEYTSLAKISNGGIIATTVQIIRNEMGHSSDSALLGYAWRGIGGYYN